MAPESDPGRRSRAKVYCLNEEGQWDDRGTGHARVMFLSDSEQAYIMLTSEEDGGHLVKAKVHRGQYQRQQDTILSWQEPETGVDYALSFQEPDGCTEVWEQICAIQEQRNATEGPAGNADGGGGVTEGAPMSAGGGGPSGVGGGGGPSGEGPSGAADQIVLPACELRNLPSIAELLSEVPLMRRAKVAEVILQREYIPQLVDLFSTAEDLESADDLNHLFTIFKGVVMLNNSGVYEVLLREDMLMGVIGALEYDPELRCHGVRHRVFLRDVAQFREVVPFSDPVVVKKVKQNFHLGFLKDVVLPRALDDNTFAALNQLQFYNNVNIISSLSNDAKFFEELKLKLQPPEPVDTDDLLLALRLVQELCSVTKTLQLYHRAAFYRKVVDFGVFDALAAAIERPEAALRLAAIDVLLASTLHDPSLLRHHVLQQLPAEGRMLPALLKVLTSGDSSGEKPQVMEVLRALLDPETMEGREQDDFLNQFYEKHVHELAQPVAGSVQPGTGPMNGTSSAVKSGGSEGAADGAVADGEPSYRSCGSSAAAGSSSDGSKPAPSDDGLDGVLSARQYVCELLCFCVAKHSYRIKYFILRNNILSKVLKLASHRDKCLVLAALRFFRQCVGLKDEFYNRYIIKNRCFEPVIAQLQANIKRDNLVHSAILELFEFVRKENVKSLIAHLADVYEEQLKPLTHVEIFSNLLLRHEQNEEFRRAGGQPQGLVSQQGAASAGGAGGGAGGVGQSASFGARRAPPPYVGGRRAFPDEDEDAAYFNASDDEEDEASGEQVSVPTKGLNSYRDGVLPREENDNGWRTEGGGEATPTGGGGGSLRPDGSMYSGVGVGGGGGDGGGAGFVGGDGPMPLIPQDSERSVGLGGHFGPSTSLSAASSMPLFQQRDSEAAAQPPAQTAVPTPPQQGAVESSSSSSEGKENSVGGPLPPLGIIAPAVLTGSPHNSPNSRLPTSPPGAHLSPVGPPRPPTPPMGQAATSPVAASTSTLPNLLADYGDDGSPAGASVAAPAAGLEEESSSSPSGDPAAKRQRTEQSTT